MTGPPKVLPALGRFIAGTLGLLLIASILVFGLIRSAPGDPVETEFGITGADAFLTAEQQQEARELRRIELGLDGPLPVQYVRWLRNVIALDLGLSYRTGQPVAEELLTRLPASLGLGLAGFAVALVLAVGLAFLGARWQGSAVDHSTRVLTLVAAAVPTFLSGVLLLRFAAQHFDYPLAGPATLSKVWLPALVMGVSSVATMSRLLRASLIAEGAKPYAAAAAARGAGPARVLVRHVARPAATPVLTLVGLTFANLVAGSIITETIFAWPGVNAYAIGAIGDEDYAVVQAYVLLVVAVVVVVNRGVDALQTVLDPRVQQRVEGLR